MNNANLSTLDRSDQVAKYSYHQDMVIYWGECAGKSLHEYSEAMKQMNVHLNELNFINEASHV